MILKTQISTNVPILYNTYFKLTPLGQALETSLLELGKWGSQFVPAEANGAPLLNVGSYALTLKTFFRPEQA